MPLTALSCTKYLRDRCKNWNSDLIHLYRAGSTLKIILIVDDKLKIINTFPEKYELDTLIPQIDEALSDLSFDEREYYQPYTSLTPSGEEYDPNNPSHKANPSMFSVSVNVGSVLWMKKMSDDDMEDEHAEDGISEIRKSNAKYAKNLGFKSVGKTEKALSWKEWIAENS